MDERYKSSIPPEATEQVVSECRREGNAIWLRRTKCLFDGKVVGERFYEEDGTLVIETPLKDGKRHGVVYCWHDTGELLSAEPYVDGLLHGTSLQWSEDGALLGTYALVHGTGYDIWRNVGEDGRIYISEIHSLQAGLPHGFEWWLNEDQRSVWEERHWHLGELHGIERRWNRAGGLSRGWPKYWVRGERVTKKQYLRAVESDASLPAFREADQFPKRNFPDGLQRLLTGD
ncbi:MAG TPA: hypothetical protein VNO70_00125 [Blastocatellia bacterium]|nr:hypothetical protein [Blastocatellia bacterium]